MAKIIDILISAKNQTSQAIGQAQGGILGLAQSFLTSKLSIITAWGAVVAKVAEGALKLVSLYDVQEKAVRKLAVTHELFGESANTYIKAEQRIASAIQDEIGKGDEATLALMGRLRMYGVMPGALEQATKATYALQAAGMGEEQASRAVALAMQGNYTMLNRYVPALRDATTEEEKHQAFLKTVEVGYQMAQEDLNSYSGSIVNLKGRLGDLGEVFGHFINHNNWINKSITATADGIKWLTSEIDNAINGTNNVIDNTIDVQQLERDEKALEKVYTLTKDIALEKKKLVELAENKAQLEADEKALPVLKKQWELLKEQLEVRKAILKANAKDQVNDVKERKRREKEEKRQEKQNAKWMNQGQNLWEQVQGAHGQRAIELAQQGNWGALQDLTNLTNNQMAKLEVFLARAKANAEINGPNFNPFWQPNAAKQFELLDIDKKLAEGLKFMEDRAKAHLEVTKENIETQKEQLEQLEDAYGTMEDIKKNIKELEKQLAQAKSESNLYQQNIEAHTRQLEESTEAMKGYILTGNEILEGVRIDLKNNLLVR